MERTPACLKKLDRLNAALRHQEPDRVPVSDFFWSGFLDRWREELGLAVDADVYSHYDLDWIVTVPNMDPHIRDFEVLEESDDEIVLRTGFEAVLRKTPSCPMPEFVRFETDTIERAEAFEFDDPRDDRRFLSGGDNQIAGVGDRIHRDSPPWIETVRSLRPNFPVYGSQCEANEYMTRLIGQSNLLLWIGLYPERMGRFIQRTNEWALELLKAQIQAAEGALDGMVIWGDIAYRKDLFFSPDYWRAHYKPGLRAMVDVCHQHGLPVIYHGCGNVERIFEDFIEIGVDAYNPLEAKAGMDVVELRRRFGHRMAFCGNMDIVEWARKDERELEAIVLRKLNAAKGGGLIFQSDHSIPPDISPRRYELVLDLVRERGRYPLELGEHDLPDLR